MVFLRSIFVVAFVTAFCCETFCAPPPVTIQSQGRNFAKPPFFSGIPTHPSWASNFAGLTKNLVSLDFQVNISSSAYLDWAIVNQRTHVAFGGEPLNAQEYAQVAGTYPSHFNPNGIFLISWLPASIQGRVNHFPVFVSADDLVYNIPSWGIKGRLNLTATILANIYTGRVTAWVRM